MTANQTSAVAQQFNLGAVNQIAYVVRSIDQSLPAYEAIFGKFQVYETTTQVTYRGKAITAQLKTALNRSGPVEIELCEAVAGGPPHGEYLERHGEGLYHVRIKVERLQETLAAMEAAGFVKFYSAQAKSVHFAYVEAPAALGHMIIELIELIPGAS